MKQYFEVQLNTSRPLTLLQIAALNQSRRISFAPPPTEKRKIKLLSIDRVGRRKLYAVLTKKNPDYEGPQLSLADVQIIEDESNPPYIPSEIIMVIEDIWDDEIDNLELKYSFDRMIADIPVLKEKEE